MNNPFSRTYTQNELTLIDFLLHNRLFTKLSRKEMLFFLPYLHLRIFKQDEVIFFRNDPSQALYLIKEGKVSLELDISERFETIVYLQKNAALGSEALLTKSKRTYNAMVSSPFCQLYVIPQVNIHTIFERRPSIKAKMLESFGEVLNENFNALFKAYRSAHGFFDMKEMFRDNMNCV